MKKEKKGCIFGVSSESDKVKSFLVYMLYTYLQHQNDTIIKTQEDLFINICTLSLYCKGSKRVTQGLRVRGSWKPNRNFNILTSTLMAVNVVSFSFSRCSTEGPEAYSSGWWLSLLHFISIFSGPHSSEPKPLRPGVAFPTTSRLQLEFELNCLDFCLDWVI